MNYCGDNLISPALTTTKPSFLPNNFDKLESHFERLKLGFESSNTWKISKSIETIVKKANQFDGGHLYQNNKERCLRPT